MTDREQSATYSVFGEGRALVIPPSSGRAPVPVLTFLHGRGEAAGDETGRPLPEREAEAVLRRHGPAAFLAALPPDGDARRALAELRRHVVICPQLPRVRQWQEADVQWVTALEDDAIHTHGGDPSRRRLAGFSWGGAGVTRFASHADCAGRWRSLVIVDPNPDPRVTPIPPISCPALLYCGSYFPGDAMVASRTAAGFDGRFAPGAIRAEKVLDRGHVEVAGDAFADPDLYDWLSSWDGPSKTVVPS
jgi:hypothetical protein